MPQLAGPPPPELAGRFQVLKTCVLAFIAALVLNIFTGIFTGILNAIGSSLTLIFLCITGIFLMNDDDQLRPAYNFMMRTCFQPCQDQCPGGMSCLVSFGIVCFVSVVLDLIMGQGKEIYVMTSAIFSGNTGGKPLIFVVALARLLSRVIAVVFRIVGSFYCWKAYQDYRDMATLGGGGGGGGGDWGNEQRPPSGGQMWGGGTVGGGGGGGGQPTSQEFQAFQGSGQRLGGE